MVCLLEVFFGRIVPGLNIFPQGRVVTQFKKHSHRCLAAEGPYPLQQPPYHAVHIDSPKMMNPEVLPRQNLT